MTKRMLLLAGPLLLGGLLARPAAAQGGFALKAHYLLNASTAESARQTRDVPAADGFGLGAEVVLPGGLGLGVSGYTAGETSVDNVKTSEYSVLAEANYFLRLPLIPVAPYAGVLAGLGRLDRSNVTDPQLQLQDRTRSQLGYQLGVRVQATHLVGLDALWRRVSTSAAAGQDGRLERDQVLIGVTIF